MATIKVPKTPRRAFNPDRRASDLLKQQIEHLEWAVRHAGERRTAYAKAVTRIKGPKIRTEGDAARRTAELVQQLPSAAELPTYSEPIAEVTPAPPKRKPSARRKQRKVAASKRTAAKKRVATKKTKTTKTTKTRVARRKRKALKRKRKVAKK